MKDGSAALIVLYVMIMLTVYFAGQPGQRRRHAADEAAAEVYRGYSVTVYQLSTCGCTSTYRYKIIQPNGMQSTVWSNERYHTREECREAAKDKIDSYLAKFQSVAEEG